MSKKAESKVVSKPKSLTASLQKVSLPHVVFHVDDDYRITILMNLEFDEDDQQGACGCSNILGDEPVFDGGPMSDPQYYNKHQVTARDCYNTLAEAKAAVAYRRRLKELDEFKRKHIGYNATQSTQIRLLKNYPDLVLQYLRDEFKIEENSPLTPETLKVSHYRMAVEKSGFGRLFQMIVAREFPDLVNLKDNDDEE